ncbi:MAG TPA: PLDc N-terminal domain-containing protein [Mycobacteriales bacterium]|nr:PLDc N-terminal domain-containing protein [Mycobacteriales bacterium]
MLIANAVFVAEVALFAALAIVPTWWAIVDVAKRPTADLLRLGAPRLVWILLILLIGPFGGVGYLLYARIRLRQPKGAAA